MAETSDARSWQYRIELIKWRTYSGTTSVSFSSHRSKSGTSRCPDWGYVNNLACFSIVSLFAKKFKRVEDLTCMKRKPTEAPLRARGVLTARFIIANRDHPSAKEFLNLLASHAMKPLAYTYGFMNCGQLYMNRKAVTL